MAKFLLDTHIFIWADSEPNKLSHNVQNILLDDSNQIYLSMVSLWEMQIKIQLGKLVLNTPLKQAVDRIKQNQSYRILPIYEQDLWTLETLPFYHKDPFDRLLVAQAINSDLTLITVDEHIIKYDVCHTS